MLPPDRLLNILRRCIDHVRATPGRTGHVVKLQSCREVLVAGDLHGHLANFQTIYKAADLGNHPARHLVLQEVVHSQFFYPNGGDKSHQLIDLFAALKCQYPGRVHYLPGNHEMAQMTGRNVSKGAASQNELFDRGVQAAYGTAAADILRAYSDLFRASPLALRTPNEVFISHSLIPAKQLTLFHQLQLHQESYTETDYQPGGVVYGLLWGRDTSQKTADDFLAKVNARLLVTGHIPTDHGYATPNSRQLIVDCMGSPAAYVLFPAEGPISLEQLVAGVVQF